MKNLYTLILLTSMTAGNVFAMMPHQQQPHNNQLQVNVFVVLPHQQQLHNNQLQDPATTKRFFESRVGLINALVTPQEKQRLQLIQQNQPSIQVSRDNNSTNH